MPFCRPPRTMSHPCGSYNDDTLDVLRDLHVVRASRSNMSATHGGSLWKCRARTTPTAAGDQMKKITVFTSNQARHLALIERLCAIADRCFAVTEATPSIRAGDRTSFNKSPVCGALHFGHVVRAEQTLFGDVGFVDPHARTHGGPQSDLEPAAAGRPCLDADADAFCSVPVSSKGWLCDHLVGAALQLIHMGLSPYYRGSSQLLGDVRRHRTWSAPPSTACRGAGQGPMLFHALPR